MEKAKHTPAPWTLVPTVDTTRVNIFGTAQYREYHIGTLQGSSLNDVSLFKANARLIAAAPMQNAALKKAESFIAGFEGDETQEGIAELLREIRQALAGAENV